jgi:hypothetical protein
MKRYYKALVISIFLVSKLQAYANAGPIDREYYELRIYHMKDSMQVQMVDRYLELALLPALHKAGIAKVGVFKAITNDTAADKLLYILIPVKSPDQLIKLKEKLSSDATYQAAGKEYLEASYQQPPYTRIESLLLYAFPLAPKMQTPQLKSTPEERIYELRSYESATEKIGRNKVQMFNEGGEITLFKRLGFNAVFYAEAITGDVLPNLMYMTCFENKADRDAHWKTFGADPEWKKISSMPEYQHNVSHIDIIFLRPTAYSDI